MGTQQLTSTTVLYILEANQVTKVSKVVKAVASKQGKVATNSTNELLIVENGAIDTPPSPRLLAFG